MNDEISAENIKLLLEIVSRQNTEKYGIYVKKEKSDMPNSVGICKKNDRWQMYFNDEDKVSFNLAEYGSKNEALKGLLLAIKEKNFLPYSDKEKYYDDEIRKLLDEHNGKIGDWHFHKTDDLKLYHEPYHAGLTEENGKYILYQNLKNKTIRKIPYTDRTDMLMAYHSLIKTEKEIDEVSERVAKDYKRSLFYSIFIGK